ncbi:MAG: 30S ribosomal protein S12 methylthiotransferase RimO [Thermodesulfobacteriota bacterium]
MDKGKVSVISLGCPKNEVDSEVMLGSLKNEGYRLTTDLSRTETTIVNTCAFTQEAKEESIRTVLNVAQLKRAGGLKRLVMVGCLPQRYQEELRSCLPEVDLFVGVNQFAILGSLLKQGLRGCFFATGESGLKAGGLRVRSNQLPYAYVKIAEGCSSACSFCAIPGIRGPARSRPETAIIAEAEKLADQGIKEIILVAQELTCWGRDLGGDYNLSRLIKGITRLEGISWIRLLYLHPQGLDEELVDTIAGEEKIVKYLDLPLQHVEPDILKMMNRGGNYHDLLSLCCYLRERIAGVVLRTAFIVGFPGEKESHFQRLVEFVSEARFDALGVFKYSREEGTEAYRLPGQLSEGIKERRWRALMAVQREISWEKNRGRVGKIEPVLIDSATSRPGHYLGRLKGQAPQIDSLVRLEGSGLKPGEIIPAVIQAAGPYHLSARAVTEKKS